MSTSSVASPRLMREVQVGVVAEALIKVAGPTTRERAREAAAIALALLDEETGDRLALYAAVDEFLPLESQTSGQRLEMADLLARVIARYRQTLAGLRGPIGIARLQRHLDADGGR